MLPDLDFGVGRAGVVFFCANALLLVAMSTTTRPKRQPVGLDSSHVGLPDVVVMPFSLIGSSSSFEIHSIPLAEAIKTKPAQQRLEVFDLG